jgi:hypothetical protein
VVLAFRRALERQAGLEAANLVHPDDARRLQQADIRRLAGRMAAARLRQKPSVGDEAIIFVNRDIAHSHRQVEEFRESPVTSFPNASQLGELASLRAQIYLPKSFEAQAAEGARHGAPGPRALRLEVVATVEESPDVVRVELRAPDWRVTRTRAWPGSACTDTKAPGGWHWSRTTSRLRFPEDPGSGC